MFLLVGFACLVCIVAVAIASYLIEKDVAKLRSEQVQLQANVKALEATVDKVVLTTCNDEIMR